MQVATRGVTNGKGSACVLGVRLKGLVPQSSSVVKVTRTTGRYTPPAAVRSTDVAGLLQAAGGKLHAFTDSCNMCA